MKCKDCDAEVRQAQLMGGKRIVLDDTPKKRFVYEKRVVAKQTKRVIPHFAFTEHECDPDDFKAVFDRNAQNKQVDSKVKDESVEMGTREEKHEQPSHVPMNSSLYTEKFDDSKEAESKEQKEDGEIEE